LAAELAARALHTPYDNPRAETRYPNPKNTKFRSKAVLLPRGLETTIPHSKRGTLTLPPALRRKLRPDRLSNPMVLVDSCSHLMAAPRMGV